MQPAPRKLAMQIAAQYLLWAGEKLQRTLADLRSQEDVVDRVQASFAEPFTWDNQSTPELYKLALYHLIASDAVVPPSLAAWAAERVRRDLGGADTVLLALVDATPSPDSRLLALSAFRQTKSTRLSKWLLAWACTAAAQAKGLQALASLNSVVGAFDPDLPTEAMYSAHGLACGPPRRAIERLILGSDADLSPEDVRFRSNQMRALSGESTSEARTPACEVP
jgi:hypothetical protein